MYCPYCGAESSEDAGFCQSCSADLSNINKPPPEQPILCQNCSTENDSRARFCKSCGAKMPERTGVLPPHQVPLPPPRVDYAGFWRRGVAIAIDLIILKIAGSLINVLTMGSIVFTPHISPGISPGLFGLHDFFSGFFTINFTVKIIITWLYFCLMESSVKQATLGKMALSIVVTDLNGNRVSFWRATGRYLGKFVSGMILMIGYIMAGVTARKQALHDIMAGCLVLVKR